MNSSRKSVSWQPATEHGAGPLDQREFLRTTLDHAGLDAVWTERVDQEVAQ